MVQAVAFYWLKFASELFLRVCRSNCIVMLIVIDGNDECCNLSNYVTISTGNLKLVDTVSFKSRVFIVVRQQVWAIKMVTTSLERTAFGYACNQKCSYSLLIVSCCIVFEVEAISHGKWSLICCKSSYSGKSCTKLSGFSWKNMRTK